MPPLTQKNINDAYLDLVRAGHSHDEAVGVLGPYIDEVAAAQSGIPSTLRSLAGAPASTGKVGLTGGQHAALWAGPFLGGSLLSGGGARLAASPRVASRVEALKNPVLRWLGHRGTEFAQTAGEFTGVTLGDIAGRKVAGVPQNLKESAIIGAAGAGIGSTYRGLARGGGYVGGVPRTAVQRAGVPTYGIVPSLQRVTRPMPRTAGQADAGISALGRLADRARVATTRMTKNLTPERAQKVELLKKADEAGVMIDPMPLLDTLLERVPKMKIEPTTIPFARYLEEFGDNLVVEATRRGGKFKPTEFDEFIRTNLDPRAYTAAGDPSMVKAGPVVREIEHMSRQMLRDHLSPSVRDLDRIISDKLFMAREAEFYYGADKTGVINRLQNVGNPGQEDLIPPLRFLSQYADKGLYKNVTTVNSARQFTIDVRGEGGIGGYFGFEKKLPTEFIAQYMAPLQSYVGPAVGPWAARKYLESARSARQRQEQQKRDDQAMIDSAAASPAAQANLEAMTAGSTSQELAKRRRGGEPRRRGPNP